LLKLPAYLQRKTVVRSKIISVLSKQILNTKSISAEELLSVNGETSTFRCAHYISFTDFTRQPSNRHYERKNQILDELRKFLRDVIAEFGNSVTIDISFDDSVDSGDVD
jgi:hypothetical protein